MADSQWWTDISTEELLHLRRDLTAYVRAKFGTVLGAELEDIVQHAFIVLFERRESVSPEDDGLIRYLRTVARRAALGRIRTDRLRRRRIPQIASERRPESSTVPDPLPFVGAAEETEKIWKVFCALDDFDRLVLWSHVVDGKSVRAIARELDLNWHRVAGTIRGALDRIRRELET